MVDEREEAFLSERFNAMTPLDFVRAGLSFKRATFLIAYRRSVRSETGFKDFISFMDQEMLLIDEQKKSFYEKIIEILASDHAPVKPETLHTALLALKGMSDQTFDELARLANNESGVKFSNKGFNSISSLRRQITSWDELISRIQSSGGVSEKKLNLFLRALFDALEGRPSIEGLNKFRNLQEGPSESAPDAEEIDAQDIPTTGIKSLTTEEERRIVERLNTLSGIDLLKLKFSFQHTIAVLRDRKQNTKIKDWESFKTRNRPLRGLIDQISKTLSAEVIIPCDPNLLKASIWAIKNSPRNTLFKLASEAFSSTNSYISKFFKALDPWIEGSDSIDELILKLGSVKKKGVSEKSLTDFLLKLFDVLDGKVAIEGIPQKDFILAQVEWGKQLTRVQESINEKIRKQGQKQRSITEQKLAEVIKSKRVSGSNWDDSIITGGIWSQLAARTVNRISDHSVKYMDSDIHSGSYSRLHFSLHSSIQLNPDLAFQIRAAIQGGGGDLLERASRLIDVLNKASGGSLKMMASDEIPVEKFNNRVIAISPDSIVDLIEEVILNMASHNLGEGQDSVRITAFEEFRDAWRNFRKSYIRNYHEALTRSLKPGDKLILIRHIAKVIPSRLEKLGVDVQQAAVDLKKLDVDNFASGKRGAFPAFIETVKNDPEAYVDYLDEDGHVLSDPQGPWIKGYRVHKSDIWFEQDPIQDDSGYMVQMLDMSRVDEKAEEQKLEKERQDEEKRAEEEARQSISQELVDTLGEQALALSVRYGKDIKTILWGMVGWKYKDRFDQKKIESILDQEILKMINGSAQAGTIITKKQLPKSLKAGAPPVVFNPPPLTQEDISKIGQQIEQGLSKIPRSEANDILRQLALDQAREFIFKLEENYLFRTYYRSASEEEAENVPTIQLKKGKELEVINNIMEEEKSSMGEGEGSIVLKVLEKLLDEIKEALNFQDELKIYGIKTDLNLYQLVAVKKMLIQRRILLADEMGVGKTLEVIATFLAAEHTREMLVEGPLATLTVFQRDSIEHTDIDMQMVFLNVEGPSFETMKVEMADGTSKVVFKDNPKIEVVHITDEKKRYEYLLNERPKIDKKRMIFMNYELMDGFVRTYPDHPEIVVDMVAFDEAHRIKNMESARTEALLGTEDGKGGVVAKYKIMMTGTPLENSVTDMFTYIKYLARGGDDNYEKFFSAMNFKELEHMFSEKDVTALAELHGYISKIMIRRLKADVLSGLAQKNSLTALCDPVEKTVTEIDENGNQVGDVVHLEGDYNDPLGTYEGFFMDPQGSERAYQHRIGREVEKERTWVDALVRMTQLTRLEQVALHPELVKAEGDSIKFDAIREMLRKIFKDVRENITKGERTIIFTDYQQAIPLLGDYLKAFLEKEYKESFDIYGYKLIARVDGTVTGKARDDNIAQFQTGNAVIMLATTGAAGVAINLTRAQNVIFLNNNWKPSAMNQAIDRAHRLVRDIKKRHKTLRIVSLQYDIPGSIDAAKKLVLRKKEILTEMLVNGNLTPEIMDAFDAVEAGPSQNMDKFVTSEVSFTPYELTIQEKFKELLRQIYEALPHDQGRALEIWNKAAPFYFKLVGRKASFFANMASLDFMSKHFPELTEQRKPQAVLDLGSGPTTLRRAYDRNYADFLRLGLILRIKSYDNSAEMLKLGETEEGAQVLGSFEDLGKALDKGLYKKGQFNIINLSFAFQLVSHPAKLMRDVYDLLSENGLFVLILPNNYEITKDFRDALEMSGFNIRVGRTNQESKLKFKLPDSYFHQLAQEHGLEYAKDVKAAAEGQVTYLVAKKAGLDETLRESVTDKDFRINRTQALPTVDEEKIKRFKKDRGREFLPDNVIVEGDVPLSEEPVVPETPAKRKTILPDTVVKQLSDVLEAMGLSAQERIQQEGVQISALEVFTKLRNFMFGNMSKWTFAQRYAVAQSLKNLGNKKESQEWFEAHGEESKIFEQVIHDLRPSVISSMPEGPSNAAMINTNPGGIDLTTAHMNIKTENKGGEIKFHINPAMLRQLQNAPGFVPVIINIQPLKDIPAFLGIDQPERSFCSIRMTGKDLSSSHAHAARG